LGEVPALAVAFGVGRRADACARTGVCGVGVAIDALEGTGVVRGAEGAGVRGVGAGLLAWGSVDHGRDGRGDARLTEPAHGCLGDQVCLNEGGDERQADTDFDVTSG